MNNIITYNVLGMMFEVNKTEMTESGQIAIDRIAKQIKDILTKESEKYSSKTPRIEILGYTDSLGTAEEKNRISLQRAQNVKKYIIEKFEIPENMLFAIGKADSEAIGDNALPDGRAKNRRVKILFIEPTAIEHSAKVIDGLVSKIKEKQN